MRHVKERGFTLMEVLVAMTLTSLVIGVLLAGLAQSHNLAFRGDMAREAAQIGEMIFLNGDETPFRETEKEEVPGHPGWRYSISIKEAVVAITSETGEEEQKNIPELQEVVLAIFPPNEKRAFRVSRWIAKIN